MVKKKIEENPEEKIEGKEPEEKPEEKVEKKPEVEELKGLSELLGKSTAELKAIAKEKGVDTKLYLTKDEVAKAILEVEKAEE